MIKFIRRFAVLSALLFWQGGFTFYAAAVVPVGQRILGSPLEQGLITRQVTHYLNIAGAVALFPLIWDALAVRDPSRGRKVGRCLAWVIMGAALGLLVWLHGNLDRLFDADAMRILDRTVFRSGHRWYLWVSTIQWACALAYLALSLPAWSAEDCRILEDRIKKHDRENI